MLTQEQIRAHIEAHSGWRNHPLTQRLRSISMENWITWALVILMGVAQISVSILVALS